MMRAFFLFTATVGFFALPAALAAQTTPVSLVAPAAPASVTMNEGYLLGIGDTIEVSVLGRDEYKPRVQIQADGTIQLPYIASMPAVNRTILQLRDDIRTRLKAGGYYTDPAVNVIVATYSSRFVVVLGQVTTPGVLPVDRAYHVSEILARAGGARDSGTDTITLRRTDGSELQLPIEKVAMGGPTDDPIVNPGDKLYVGPAPTFYIKGQVKASGNYKLAPNMTIEMALAQAGGISDRGSEKRIKITRSGQPLPAATLLTEIKPGDVITIGERFF